MEGIPSKGSDMGKLTGEGEVEDMMMGDNADIVEDAY
jgi:hypothetical protein